MTFSLVDHKSCPMVQSLDTISDFFKIISYHNYAVSCISELQGNLVIFIELLEKRHMHHLYLEGSLL